MQIGHFIHGMIDGAIEHRQSSNLESLLSEEALQFLIGQVNKGDWLFTWRLEGAFSRTVVKETKDKDGRRGLLNHTIVVKLEPRDFLRYVPGFPKLLDGFFFNNVDRNPLPDLVLEV